MKRALATLALIVAVALCADAARAFNITFRDQATTRGDHVTLQDIALVEDTRLDFVLSLYRLRLAQAPELGRSVQLLRPAVLARLKTVLSPVEMARVNVPPVIVVSREQARLNRQTIEDRFRQFVTRHMSWDPTRVNIYAVTYRGELNFPAGRVQITIVPAGNTDYRGHVALDFHIRIDDRLVRVMRVRGQVDVLSDTVVAARPIEPGHVIRADDVKLVRAKEAYLSPGVATSVRQVVGRQAKSGLFVGQRVHLAQLEHPRVIRRGAMVTIVAQRGRLRITAPGQAMAAAVAGEKVPVLNLASKRTIYARAVDSATVKVEF